MYYREEMSNFVKGIFLGFLFFIITALVFFPKVIPSDVITFFYLI